MTLARDSSAAGSDAWRVGPGGAPAASGAVGDLLDVLDGLEVNRVATATPASAGLDPPAVHLTIAAARRFALDVGGVDASGRGAFVRRDGDARIFVVGQRLRELVDRDAGAFRDRRLFSAATIDGATTLVFRSEDGPPQTLRKRSGLWLDEQGTFATRAALGEALRLLVALRASGFSVAPPSTDGGGPTGGHRSLELTGDAGGAGTGARLEVWDAACPGEGGTPGQLAAYTVDGEGRVRAERARRDLPRPRRRRSALAAARGRQPARSAPAGRRSRERRRRGRCPRARVGCACAATTTASGISSSRPSATAPMRRWSATGSRSWRRRRWTMAAPPERTAAAHDRAAIWWSKAQRAPRSRSRLRTARQARVDRAGESVPALVGASAFAALEPEPLRFRSRAMLALPQFDVRAIELRRGPTTVRLKRESGTEWIREGEGEPPDASAVDHLLSMLSDLRAEEFVTPPPAAFKADTTVDVEVRSGEAPPQHHRLELAAKCRARVDDTPVFTLPARTCGDLEHTLAGI